MNPTPATPPTPARHRVPGGRLRALTVALFDSSTAERMLFPAIADLQHEAHAVGANSSPLVRAVVCLRAYAAFWCAFGTCLVARSMPAERDAWWRVAAGSGTVLVVATTAFMCLPLQETGLSQLGFAHCWRLAPFLVPQALAVAIPASVLGGGWLASRARPTGPIRAPFVRPILVYSLVATFCTLAVLIWAVPAANQEYRQRVYQIFWRPSFLTPRTFQVPPGYSEMTVGQLVEARRRQILRLGSPGWDAERAHVTFRIHLVGALPAASLAFGLLAIAMAPPRRHPRVPPVASGLVFGVIAAFLYYAALDQMGKAVSAVLVPAWFGAWALPAAFSIVALVLIQRRAVRGPAAG